MSDEQYSSLNGKPQADGCASGNWPPKGGYTDMEVGSKQDKVAGLFGVDADKAAKDQKRAMWISILTLIVSIPALIGAWCWPALVIGLFAGTVSTAARSLGHYISFGVTGSLMVAVNCYVGYCVKRRYGTFWQKWGPLIFTLVATPLIMADLVRHVLQDTKLWPEPGSAQFRPGCNAENMTCLSAVGWLFTVFFTYSGFVCLAVGTMWNANLMDKIREIRKEWKALREAGSSVN